VIDTNDIVDAVEDELYRVEYQAHDIDPTSDVLHWTLSTNAATKRTHRLTDVFLKSYNYQLLNKMYTKDYQYPPKDQADTFRKDDMKMRNIERFKIMQTIEDNQPVTNFKSAGDSEVSVLKRENEKKRRLLPIRVLMDKIPNLVFTLKPCFMMSPLTVSQYINPDAIQFDVVIFDEASQIMPQDAVACLMRARQAIIMGDTKQLPPTSFFQMDDDSAEDEGIVDLESFLSEISTRFPTETLDWHYRSKNENLIAYSNQYFYDNRLITFPNPDSSDTSGLKYEYVEDGLYYRGKSRQNPIEAARVAQVYKKLLAEQPKRSVGIIAFSIAQEKAIRAALAEAGVEVNESIDPQVEELFIKNLETVQGDERDIIIISVGYGKDPEGKFTYNFGPINQEGGYKRLNVAISRSRFMTIVVSSLDPDEMDDGRIKNQGAKFLKAYLDFAKTGNFEQFMERTDGGDFDHQFVRSVENALKQVGYNLRRNVGFSGFTIDIGIEHPNKAGAYVMGIECDGSHYQASRFARDRDKVRHEVLASLGWILYRVWSEDWLNDKDQVLGSIKKMYDDILSGTLKPSKPSEDKFKPIEDVHDFEEVSLKSQYNDYPLVDLGVSDLQLAFKEDATLTRKADGAKIATMMKKVIRKEAPITRDFLFIRVNKAIPKTRMSPKFEQVLIGILKEVIAEMNLTTYGTTIALEPIEVFTQPRISTEDQRPFDQIPREEVGGAVMAVVNNTLTIARDPLTLDVAREVYHFSRTGPRIRAKVDEAIEYLKANGLIQEDIEGKISLV